ncbi:MAG TPA: hypothetical protein VGM54_15180 [Chthoniobacter sp.]
MSTSRDTTRKHSTSSALPTDLQPQRLLSRRQVCQRWACCPMTLARREAAGLLQPIRFNARLVRYRLSDIEAIENAAQAATGKEA